MRPDHSLRYQATDSLRPLISIGLGTQLALLSVHSAVLLPTIVFGAANAGDSLLWAIFGGMLACGVITAVQAVQPGRLGSGYQMLHGCSAPFIAVCVAALAQGGRRCWRPWSSCRGWCMWRCPGTSPCCTASSPRS